MILISIYDLDQLIQDSGTMYVCICNAITDRDIREAVSDGVRTLPELKMKTGCGTACGRCEEVAREVLSSALPAPPVLRIVSSGCYAS
jgi:bacterioferritin-associated ferredoxin